MKQVSGLYDSHNKRFKGVGCMPQGVAR